MAAEETPIVKKRNSNIFPYEIASVRPFETARKLADYIWEKDEFLSLQYESDEIKRQIGDIFRERIQRHLSETMPSN